MIWRIAIVICLVPVLNQQDIDTCVGNADCIDEDDCAERPCRNDGVCRDLLSDYRCYCQPPFSGKNCTSLPCDHDPCYHGDCFNDVTKPNYYRCRCHSGFTGPRCQDNVNDCHGNACGNGGKCMDLVNGYACVCYPPYSGPGCTEINNYCIDNRCHGNGTESCASGDFTYSCRCLPGWGGDLCNVDVDDCSTDPCMNNGSCIDQLNKFSCLCPPPYHGPSCETVSSPCASCADNATCVHNENYTECLCPSGWHGNQCEQEADVCQNGTCVNGECSVEEEGGYRCECFEGYSGFHCEINVNDCASDPCQGQGHCQDLVNDYQCFCYHGYRGTRCEEKVDWCEDGPCQGNATCESRQNHYYCQCPPGVAGRNCSVDLNECWTGQASCFNGATCVNTHGGYRCQCRYGYQGVDCGINTDDCTPSPCLHGGACVDEVGGYVCQCPNGYSGHHCGIKESATTDPTETSSDYDGYSTSTDWFSSTADVVSTTLKSSASTSSQVIVTSSVRSSSETASSSSPTSVPTGCMEGSNNSAAQTIVDRLVSCLRDSVRDLEYLGFHDNDALIDEAKLIALRFEQFLQGLKSTDTCVLTSTSDHSPTSSEISATSTDGFSMTSTESWTSMTSSVTDSQALSTFQSLMTSSDSSTLTDSSGLSTETTLFSTPSTTSLSETDSLMTSHDSLTTTSLVTSSVGTKTSSVGTMTSSVETSTSSLDVSSSLDSSTSMDTVDTSPSLQQTSISEFLTSSLESETSIVSSIDTVTSSKIVVTSVSSDSFSEISITSVPSMTSFLSSELSSGTDSFMTPLKSDLSSLSGSIMTSDVVSISDTIMTSFPSSIGSQTDSIMTSLSSIITSDISEFSSDSSVSSVATSSLTFVQSSSDTFMTSDLSTATSSETFSTNGTIASDSAAVSSESWITQTSNFASDTATGTFSVINVSSTMTSLPSESLDITPIQSSDHGTTPTDGSVTFDTASDISPSTHGPSTSETSRDATMMTSSALTSDVTSAVMTSSSDDVISSMDSTDDAETSTEFATSVSTTITDSSSSTEASSISPTDPPTNVNVTCDDVICRNGGTCREVIDADGFPSFVCDCPLQHAGVICDQEIGVRYPSFDGSSLLVHRNLAISGKQLSLVLSFLPLSARGTIFYMHAESFIHLYLESSSLVLRVLCGTYVMRLRSDVVIAVPAKNLTTVEFNMTWPEGKCSASLRVDDNPIQTHNHLAFPPPTPLTAIPYFYLGGRPATPPDGMTSFPVTSGPSVSFTGCIRNLEMDGVEKDVFGEASEGWNVKECSTLFCQEVACQNGGVCSVSGDEWSCVCRPGYSGPLCERHACNHGNPCFHGATCLESRDAQSANQGYVCLCPLGKHGVHCELDLSVTRYSFSGATPYPFYPPYISFPVTGYEEYLELKINFTLARLADMTVLFMGSRDGDYLSVGVLGGRVVLLYDLGSGPALLSSAALDSARNRHSLWLGRSRQSGWLQLDDQPLVRSRSRGRMTSLNAGTRLYLGGHEMRLTDALPEVPQARNGFEGCIFDILIRTSPNANLTATSATSGRRVKQCEGSECNPQPCENGGRCYDLGSSFRCACVSGWYGALCSQREDNCSTLQPCMAGGTCVPTPTDYTCQCPVGRTGKNCQQEIGITDINFPRESSFVCYKPKRSLRQKTIIKISIKPRKLIGLFLFVTSSMTSLTGDFLALSLADSGLVEMRYNLGANTAVIVSERPVRMNAWSSLEAGRERNEGYVTVDGMTSRGGTAPSFTMLDTTSDIFVGGLPDLASVSYIFGGGVTSFQGCIRTLIINGLDYPLNSLAPSDGRDVTDCDGTPCGYNVCRNGGTCQPVGDVNVKCGCPRMFAGPRCEVPSVCDNNLCSEGARCVPDGPRYRCACPLGKTGEQCDKDLDLGSFSFGLSSSLLYRDQEYDLDEFRTTISFNFTSRRRDGIILWSGESSADDDYLGLGLRSGRLRLVWSLGQWSSNVSILPETILINAWYSVIIERTGQSLHLYLDGQRHTSTVTGAYTELNTFGIYHFGSFSSDETVAEVSRDHFTSPFDGCVRDVTIQGRSVDMTSRENITAVDVSSCDGEEAGELLELPEF